MYKLNLLNKFTSKESEKGRCHLTSKAIKFRTDFKGALMLLVFKPAKTIFIFIYNIHIFYISKSSDVPT